MKILGLVRSLCPTSEPSKPNPPQNLTNASAVYPDLEAQPKTSRTHPLDAAFARSERVGNVVNRGCSWVSVPLGFAIGGLWGITVAAVHARSGIIRSFSDALDVTWHCAKSGAGMAYDVPGYLAADCFRNP
jgi:hypothetical protein